MKAVEVIRVKEGDFDFGVVPVDIISDLFHADGDEQTCEGVCDHRKLNNRQ